MSDEQPIADRLLGPEGPELGCEECFEYLDVYVEAEAAGGAGFDVCPVCGSPDACASARSCRAMAAHLEAARPAPRSMRACGRSSRSPRTRERGRRAVRRPARRLR